MKCPGVVLSICLITGWGLSVCHAQFGKLQTNWGRTVEILDADTIKVGDIAEFTAQGLVEQGVYDSIIDFMVEHKLIEPTDTGEFFNLFIERGQRDSIYVKQADTTNPIVFVTSVGLDCFTRESKSGAYKVGLIPGYGYGIKYIPKWWTVTKYFLALDVFVQGFLSDDLETHEGSDYFNIDILPVITFMDWFGVGFGPRIKIGLKDVPHEFRSVFSFGIKKATE